MNPVTVALAVARLTQLIVEDEITRPARQAINRWAVDAPEFSLRERIATAVGCGACSSVYAAAAVLIATRVPVLRPLVRVLAASQAALALRAATDRLSR
jgi:hypothetical protein